MGIKEYIKNNEKIYKNKRDIKYLFCKGRNSDKLIVTFPAFQPNGKPPLYNYISTLLDLKDHKLYLLDDFGSRGSYLIAENRDHSIEVSVVSLILSICKKYDIKSQNVILQGSSKGAYSALYFGIKYQFGHVIAGAPQTKLGDFLFMNALEVAEFIAGGQEEDDRIFLNNLLFDLLKYPLIKFPKIYIQVGSGDDHFKNHVIPFVEELDEENINYQLDIKDYFSHSSAGIYYQDYLIKVLRHINNEKNLPLICNVDIKLEDNLLKMTCNAEGEMLEYACYIFKQDNIIKKIMYQKDSSFECPINSNGVYRAKLFAKDIENNINSELTNEIIVNDFNKNLPLICNVDIKLEDNLLKMTCNAEGEMLEYACYIFKQDNIIKKIMYQKDSSFECPINSNGVYRAKLFAKDIENNINTKVTDEIKL